MYFPNRNDKEHEALSRAEELIKQREELDKAIKEAVREERKTDLATVKQLCRKHGFTYSQVKSALGT